MIIQTIQISNFRGIEGTRKFIISGKPFILLSAPNGLGKTTLIDAIEWCFTGNIGRLKSAFDSRSTNDTERKKNIKGILKNKNAKSTDEICVVLQIANESNMKEIKRSQLKDELKEEASTVWVNGQKDKKELLKEFIGCNFYNFHFCDIQKSIGMQSRKRKDLPELFSDFISDYTKELTVADNLEIFVEDVRRYSEDLSNERISENEIKTIQEQVERYEGVSSIKKYPGTPLYQAENLEVTSLDEKGLKEQLQKVRECGYKQAEIILEELVSDIDKKDIVNSLEKVNILLTERKQQIEKAVKQELHLGNQKILDCEANIRQISEIKLTDKNIWDYSEKLLAFGDGNFTKEKCMIAKNETSAIEVELTNLEKEIGTLSKGNKILDVFSELIAKKRGLEEYRNETLQKTGQAKCPVCGSVQFGKIEVEEILNEAKTYKNQHSDLLTQKKTERDQLKEQLELLYENLLKTCNQVLTDYIQKCETTKKQLTALQNDTREFFEILKKLEVIDSDQYAVDKILSEGYVDVVLKELRDKLLSDDIIIQKQNEYKKILELLEYKMQENEKETSTIQRIRELAKTAPDDIRFDYSLLVQKMNSLNSYIGNQEYLAAKKKFDDSIEKNKNIDKQQQELQILKDKAQKRADDIRILVNQLRADEYHNVGPNLYKFYKKLSRINTIENIQISPDDENLTIEDESGSSVVNILSNGQLSVFMLAYFFAGIVSRSGDEMCKIYFIDDLTACMDDVNMLAFLDLMKYQILAKNGTIEQLFFASCDERICKLLRYKLEGCGIHYCELKENDFS